MVDWGKNVNPTIINLKYWNIYVIGNIFKIRSLKRVNRILQDDSNDNFLNLKVKLSDKYRQIIQ